MAQAAVIAKVSSINGEAFARDQSGNLRRLKVGDAVREGETVVAGNGAEVVLKLADGRDMVVGQRESVTLDAEVAAQVKPDATDSAVSSNEKGFQKIASALTDGGNLDDLLEDPAAGGAGPGGNEGHTFVEFLRVVESVDPLAYQFGTDRGRPLDTIQGAPLTRPEDIQITVGDADVAEGQDLVFDVTFSTTSANPVELNFTVTPSGANPIEANDIGAMVVRDSFGNVLTANANGSYTVPANATGVTVTISSIQDNVYEGRETF
ncbi:MAG: retention module-containing protein, partial [Azonexaceae bacterium]|nr:retention module-containing protein [Azonexaceae bacterium]